jgi:hypothetical protein
MLSMVIVAHDGGKCRAIARASPADCPVTDRKSLLRDKTDTLTRKRSDPGMAR